MAQGKSNKNAHRSGRASSTRRRIVLTSKRNQKVLLRWIALAAVLVVVIILVARCAMGGGSDKTADEAVTVDESVSRVEVSKKGVITVTSIESFDKDYYDETELQSLINSEIASYKESNGNGVSDEGLTVADGKATLVMRYDSASDYQAFNDQEMFWGTLQAAEDVGYDLSGLSGQTNAQDESETYGEGTARALAENCVIVITEPLDIITDQDILYASDNLTIAGDRYATVNGDISESTPGILILK